MGWLSRKKVIMMTNKEFNSEAARIHKNTNELLENGVNKSEAEDYRHFNLGKLSQRTRNDWMVLGDKNVDVILH